MPRVTSKLGGIREGSIVLSYMNGCLIPGAKPRRTAADPRRQREASVKTLRSDCIVGAYRVDAARSWTLPYNVSKRAPLAMSRRHSGQNDSILVALSPA